MLNWNGPWATEIGYVKSDAVSYEGSSYVAIAHSKGQPPPLEGKWVLLAQRGANGTDGTNGTNGSSVRARGEYQSSESYSAGDIVLLKDTGNSYIAKANTAPGTPPTNGDYWTILAEGMPKGNDWAAPGKKLKVLWPKRRVLQLKLPSKSMQRSRRASKTGKFGSL